MRRAIPLVLAWLAAAGAGLAAPVKYVAPEEVATLAPGPDLDVAQANCASCHSADYVSTQPRGLPEPKAFWTAEVTKMVKVYHAPIEDADARKIVDYLVTAYAK